MAKNDTDTSAPVASAPAGIAPPAVEASGGDSRSVMLTVKLTDGTSKQMKRNDYIRTRATSAPKGSPEQPTRAQIRKEVIALSGGKDVPYQVIFTATKGLYPEKDAATPAAADPANPNAAVS